MNSKETVVRLAPLPLQQRPEMCPPDGTLLLVAALVASCGPEIAQRAETMLSLMAAVDPALLPNIAQAKRLAIEARRIADVVSGVRHERRNQHISEPRCAMG